MINLKLPFFGKRGTIKNIKENKNVYVVTRYGIEEKQIVPKKKKNLDGLYKNFYDDTRNYIEASYDKYKNYKQILTERKKQGKSKLHLNINKLKIALLISGSVTTLSAIGLIALLPTASIMLYLDMSTLALSLVSLTAITNNLIGYLKDKKKDNFIKEYNNYEKELNNYNIINSKKTITKPTRYLGLSKDKNHENTLHKSKILKKEQDAA